MSDAVHPRELPVRDRVITAFDFSSLEEIREMMKQLQGVASYVKIGMQMFYLAGPALVEECKQQGFSVFVDLKVHDIPNTAKGAMESLARLGVDMVNVHAAGGAKMMQAAREGLEKGSSAGAKQPLLIAVTQLTSTDQQTLNHEIGITGTVEESVLRYASLAKENGLDGVVASPLEVPMIKEECGADFITVTPGIRPKDAAKGDQKRITTPAEAFRKGTDFIVMGRPITRAEQPGQAFKDIVQQIEQS